jgi:hypothetical protein
MNPKATFAAYILFTPPFLSFPPFSPKHFGLSLQIPLAYSRNPLFFKCICFSLTSRANSLSRKDKSHFLA